jgi:putative chitinase
LSDPLAITAERLRVVCPRLTLAQAEVHAEALEHARPVAALNTAARIRHFVAQCAHETGDFRRLTENLNYRDPAQLDRLFKAVRGLADARLLISHGAQAIANRVYAGRGGNGDEASGDGWRYRGRGYLQVTLKDNYVQLAKVSRLPIAERPELLENPVVAAQVSAHYWRWHAINAAADRDDTRAVTAHINPALAGLDDRIAKVGQARKVWP